MSGDADRLKVLFLPGWYPSEDHPVSGVFVREHARAVSLYDDVVVLHVRQATKQIRGLYTVAEESDDGLRVVRVVCRRLPMPGAGLLLRLYAYWRLFRRLMRKGFRPDVVHAHVYHAGVPAALWGRLYGIPTVLTEHSSHFPRRMMRRLHITMAHFAMTRAHVVLPVSRYLQSHIEAYGIRARFRVVPNTVETDLFCPESSGKRNGADQGPKRLLTVAVLTPVKGIPCLLDAINLLRKQREDFVLDIVGDGECRADYEGLTKRMRLEDVVEFHGLKPRAEVAKFMRRCDVFVLPSLFETFGVVAIEALASGKPVVASEVGGLPEIVTKEVGRLIPPEDPDALAEALDGMLDGYQSYQPQAIAEYARKRYGHCTVGGRLHDVYLDVLSESRNRT